MFMHNAFISMTITESLPQNKINFRNPKSDLLTFLLMVGQCGVTQASSIEVTSKFVGLSQVK